MPRKAKKETPAPAKPSISLDEFVHVCMCEGIAQGIGLFMRANNVQDGSAKVRHLTIMLTSECVPGSRYPFTNSFKLNYASAIEEEQNKILDLFNAKATRELEEFLVNLGKAVAVKFLDDERPQALKVINETLA